MTDVLYLYVITLRDGKRQKKKYMLGWASTPRVCEQSF